MLAQHAIACMSNIALEILDENRMHTDDVALVVAHQTSLQILNNIVRESENPMEKWAIMSTGSETWPLPRSP